MLQGSSNSWLLILLGALLLPLILPADCAWAQAPGSIKGTIRDGENDEMLDYANVLLKGTKSGTMSLGGGLFYFHNLPPGEYTVQVLYLGYVPEERTVTVRSGRETQIAFELKVVIVETLQVFDIEGAVYMIDVSDTKTEHKIDGDKFTDFPIDSIEEALAKQPGMVIRAGQLHVRGSRSGEVSMRIDNVPVDDPLGGRSLQVSTLGVETISSVTGGLNAEFGNALSGVVNITTKTGGKEFEGGLRYFTDDFGRQDNTFTNYDRLEYGFGGPTPIDKLTYFISGDFQFTDTENFSVANRPEYEVTVGDLTLFKFRRRQLNNVKGATKWAYSFNPDMKLTAEYSYSYSSNEFYAPNWSVSGYAKRLIYLPYVERRGGIDTFFYTNQTIPVYYGPWFERMMDIARPAVVLDERSASQIRQVMPVLEVRGIDGHEYTVVAQPTFDGFNYPYSSFSTAQEDSSYTWFNSADNNRTATRLGQVGKLVWRHHLTEMTFYTLKLSMVSFDNKTTVNDKDPWEFNHGGVNSPNLFWGDMPIYLVSGDYYTDPQNPLFITSSDYPQYREQYTRQYSLIFDITSTRWEGHLLKMGGQIFYNDLEERNLAFPAIERQNRFTGAYSLGNNRNIFHTYNPEASWYLQDRWEYEGMVVNYGVRWDLFSPGSAADILLRTEGVNRNVIKYKTQFSPRLGFAFPITERDGFNFSYGRYIQFPSRENLFASQDPIGNAGVLGNPNLQAMTTIAYQAGIQHQFTDYLAGTFALYSKDIYDLISATQVTDDETGNTLDRYINRAYASARGLELSLTRRPHKNYSLDITYTYAFADGVASEADFGANPEGLQFLPSQELPLNWDQRHTVNFLLRLEEPAVWSGSFSFTYGSGYPWTPFDRYARRQDPLLENSERQPATFSLDIQGERHVNFYGQQLTLYMQGFNLINQDQVFTLDPGIFPGLNAGAQSAYRAYLTETGKFGGAYLQDADGDRISEFIPVHDPRVFDQHRLFRVGIGWQF